MILRKVTIAAAALLASLVFASAAMATGGTSGASGPQPSVLHCGPPKPSASACHIVNGHKVCPRPRPAPVGCHGHG
jgi:hypothetical protein